jgi:hypothetical protein
MTGKLIECNAPVPCIYLFYSKYISNHNLLATLMHPSFLFAFSGGLIKMRKSLIILAVLVVFALVSSVSAFGPITFSQPGDIVVTYVSTSADFHNDFGVWLPAFQFLGRNNEATPGTVYHTGQKCVANQPVTLYITTPQSDGLHTYTSDSAAGDLLDHAQVIPGPGNSFTVNFENQFGIPPASDRDFNDVVLNVACIPSIATPEFPTLALPAALIIGLFGVVLFIRKTEG